MITVDAIIVAAMEEEIAPYYRAAHHLGDEQMVGGATARLANIGKLQVLLVRSGIGLVNAALAATAAITSVGVRALVSTGSAGGVGGGVQIGSVAVGNTYAYTGVDCTAFGYELGQLPGGPARFEGHAPYLEAAAGLEGVVVGPMVSGDTFVDSVRLGAVREAFPGALTTDMESTALAHVANAFGLPFVSVRGVSDMCGPDATGDHERTLPEVSAAAAQTILTILGA